MEIVAGNIPQTVWKYMLAPDFHEVLTVLVYQYLGSYIYMRCVKCFELTPGGSSQVAERSKFLCMGIMYVRAFPTLSHRVLGDVRQRDDKGSRQRELLLHLANIKPPASFNLGNASYSSSRNPCADTSTSDITTFSPQALPPRDGLSLDQWLGL